VSADAPTVRLDLESKPETLTLVRAALGGIADLLTIDPELLDDIKTAVSEACNNVVLHAYADGPGPLSVCLFVDEDTIVVNVRDHGPGIPVTVPSDDRMQGVGIPVIRALAREAEFLPAQDGGTDVRMTFAGTREGKRLFGPIASATPNDGWTDGMTGDAVVSVSPLTILAGVLGRLARATAATARFSLDRFSDVYLVTDAVSELAAQAASGSRIGFAVVAAPRRLELTIGPFRQGSTDRLRDGSSPDRAVLPLVRLSDKLDVESGARGDALRVVMIDHRR
jgi:serine/threonine-protein kinase RsbW